MLQKIKKQYINDANKQKKNAKVNAEKEEAAD